MRWTAFFCCASLAFAQAGGTEPKAKAEDYEAHGTAGEAAIGAEFTVHSFSGRGQMFVVKNFLTVEVALYPPKGMMLTVKQDGFRLRIDGKPRMLMPASAFMVAGTLRYPEWQTGPRLEGSVGSGPVDIVLGRPSPTRIPGGPQSRLPTPPRVPEADPPGGVQREPPVKAEDLLIQTALPEGEIARPVSGFLYFPYKGKAGSIKKVELLWGDAVLKLR